MTTENAGATVVHLESHPAWLAARRRSREIDDAMRRHPAYQSRLLFGGDTLPSNDAAVYRINAR